MSKEDGTEMIPLRHQRDPSPFQRPLFEAPPGFLTLSLMERLAYADAFVGKVDRDTHAAATLTQHTAAIY